MSIIDHILLFSFLFLFFIFFGKFCYAIRDKYKFGVYALFPILLFSLITGMRYGWGPDYLWYKFQFEYPNDRIVIEDTQASWRYLNMILDAIGFNYVGVYIFYSLVFVTCAFVLIRSYGKASKYMYAFFVPAILFSVTTTIRQGFATSFLFLALYFLKEKKWIKVFIFIVIAGFFHSGTLVVSAIILSFYFFVKKQPFNWKITIPLLLFFTYFFDALLIGSVSDLIGSFSLGDTHFTNYLKNSDNWFSEDAANSELYERSFVADIIWTLFYISFIYIGYKALKFKPDPNMIYLYNIVVFGIIFYQIVRLFEIWRRFAGPLIGLYFIVLGYSLFVLSKSWIKHDRTSELQKLNYQTISPVVYKIMLGMILLCLFLYWGRFIFLNPEANFFWNK